MNIHEHTPSHLADSPDAQLGIDAKVPVSPALLKVILGAFALGVFVFSGFAWLYAKPQSSAPDPKLFLIILVLVSCGVAAMFAMLPALMRTAARKAALAQSTPEAASQKLVQSFATQSILLGAMSESIGLLSGVAMLLTGQRLFAIGAGVSVCLLILLMPTPGKLRAYVAKVLPQATLRE
jgi:hypothetical protein